MRGASSEFCGGFRKTAHSCAVFSGRFIEVEGVAGFEPLICERFGASSTPKSTLSGFIMPRWPLETGVGRDGLSFEVTGAEAVRNILVGCDQQNCYGSRFSKSLDFTMGGS
jgi:hypothetical protein